MYSLDEKPVGFSYGQTVAYVTDRPIDNKLIYDFLTTGDHKMNQQTFNELGELREAIKRYEWNDEFLKAALIRQIWLEFYLRSNGLPVGEYWKA